MRLILYAIVYSVIVVILSSLFMLWATAQSDEQSVMDKKVRESSWETSALTMPILLTYVEPKKRTINAWVTAYSGIESCHYAGCVDASGQRPKKNHSIACPRSYSIGTRIKIDGMEFVCTDRTAQRFDGRFDMFMGYTKENQEEAKEWGIQKKEVVIYD